MIRRLLLASSTGAWVEARNPRSFKAFCSAKNQILFIKWWVERTLQVHFIQ